jgi:hypothetical protein
MTPGTLNIELTAGDGYSHIITFQDFAGAALSQAAYTWRAQIRTTPDATTKTDFTVVVATNTVTLSLTAVQTRALLPGVYVWDGERAIGAGDPQTVLAGTVRVRSDVTRATA